ncbi:hypothetical protein FUSO6_10305, partial [Fusobacterium necrophorum DAB]
AIRNTDINIFFKYLFFLRKHGIKIMENADKIIFLSPTYKKECLNRYISAKYKEKFEKKMCIIPNGIDSFWIENLIIGKKKHEELRLIYVGSIDRNKNVKTTIMACKELRKKGYNVKFTIIGDIIVKTINLNESFINYIPFCSKEKIKEYLSKNDIFVMPSKYETFGLVYAEALSQGLPIIYTKGQGFDEQIPEGIVGHSVRYDDIEEIVRKIILIYENYEKYSNNIKNFIHNFDWINISREYSNIYNDINGGKL